MAAKYVPYGTEGNVFSIGAFREKTKTKSFFSPLTTQCFKQLGNLRRSKYILQMLTIKWREFERFRKPRCGVIERSVQFVAWREMHQY